MNQPQIDTNPPVLTHIPSPSITEINNQFIIKINSKYARLLTPMLGITHNYKQVQPNIQLHTYIPHINFLLNTPLHISLKHKNNHHSQISKNSLPSSIEMNNSPLPNPSPYMKNMSLKRLSDDIEERTFGIRVKLDPFNEMLRIMTILSMNPKKGETLRKMKFKRVCTNGRRGCLLFSPTKKETPRGSSETPLSCY